MDKSRQHIDDLLGKYFSGNISPEEYAYLAKEIQNISDEELRNKFYARWENFNEYQSLSPDKIAELYDRGIKPKMNISVFTRFKRYWVQVAASLLIIVLGGLALKFYTTTQELDRLAEHSISISSGDSNTSAVTLPDGTKVRLNVNSLLSYKQNFGCNDRKVYFSGEGYFEVKRDESKQFIVSTDEMDIAVLGTTFNVYAYKNKDFVEMALVEGYVRVTPANNPNQAVYVRPNEKVTYNRKTGKLNLEGTSNALETAWLDNKLVFRHNTLEYVFSSLERKFGIVFRIDNLRMLQDVYTGTFGNERLENILQVLQIHYGFDYRIEDKTIFIY